MVALNGHGNGKPSDPLGQARLWLSASLKLVRRARPHDPQGCREILLCTARLALLAGKLSTTTAQKLTQSVVTVGLDPDPASAAATLQKLFEQLLGDSETGEPDPDAESLTVAQEYIETAISIGAPAYNAGDHRGCYEVYACTARMILTSVEELSKSVEIRLQLALKQAAELTEANRQAWAMRNGFDDVLGMVPKNAEPIAPPEVVPIFLKLAIQIGAPVFNSGDHRGCYEVYASVARLMLRTVSASESVKETLRDALQEAALTSDVTEQAWIMRRAFDAIIESSTAPDEDPEEEESDEPQ